jgi:Fibronectin type III domain.
VSAPSVVTTGTGNPLPRTVTVSWNRSSDDGGGERDIERYAIFRRGVGAAQIGDPISSIPAQVGAYSYSFVDTNVAPGASYVYGVAAQDCTPSVSDISLSNPITVNP